MSMISKCNVTLTRLTARFARAQDGAIAVIFALMLPVIFGMIALGLEAGLWFHDYRVQQTATDAAVVTAAYTRSEGGGAGTILSDATTQAAKNSFDASVDTIVVNDPPVVSTTYGGNYTYIEVVITHQVNFLFAQVLSSNPFNSVTYAVAKASIQSAGDACVLALDSSGSALEVSGNGSVTLNNCQAASNSASSSALNISGAGTLNVDCYSVVGGVSSGGGLNTASNCTGVTGAAPIADPYATLNDPDNGSCDSNAVSYNSAGSTLTLGTGSYATPYVVCGDVTVQNGTVKFDGLVVVKGNITVNGNGAISSDSSNGTTIVLKDGGQISNINGNAQANLSAPTGSSAGVWQGILFYQDRVTSPVCTGSNCNTLNGNSSSTFQGVIYFPNQELNVSGGNEATSTCLQIIALRVGFSGNASFNTSNACSSAGVSPVNVPGKTLVTLVE